MLTCLERGELLHDFSESLATLSGQVVPLVCVLIHRLGDSLHKYNTGVDQGSNHEEDVCATLLEHFLRVAAVIPAEYEELVDEAVPRALVTQHVVELVEQGNERDDVREQARLEDSLNLVQFDDIALAEAERVKDDLIVTVHAALDAGQEMVGHVEAELPPSHIDEVGNLRPGMLVRLQVVVE